MHANDIKKIKAEIANSKRVAACAHRFGTLGDLTSMRICYLLRHYPQLSVTGIAELVGVSVSAASRSLKKLREADVLTARREYKTVYYQLQDNAITKAVLNQLGMTS